MTRIFRHRASSKVSSLALLLQRSPLVKVLLPEARVISTSGFSESVKWCVTTVFGLGAYDAVSGATTLAQLQPSPGSLTVPAIGGSNLNFVYQCLVTDGFIPGSFEVVGTLPSGLTQTGLKHSTVDNITGIPVQTGNFPVKITAYEFTNNTGRFISVDFNIAVAVPPAPSFTVHPAGGNFPAGAFTILSSTQTGGYSFTWKKNGTPLPSGESLLFNRSAPRKFFFPAEDPGTDWRSGAAYDDSAWTTISGGIGYDLLTGPVNYNPQIAAGGNVQAQMSGADKPMSVFLRMPFDLTAPVALSHLKLRVQSDDGFVAYLNGSEVAFQNKPVTNDFTWESNAVAAQPDATAVTFREINLTNRIPLLRAGTNLLAVQAMNDTYESPDFLFNCELAGGINATNSTRLVLAGLRPSDAGSYSVTATNPAGSATSNPAVINVAPAITAHPVSISIASGQTATLNAAAEGAPLTWQWFRGTSGDTANPVSGATAATFITPPLTATATYWARATNPAGSADTNTAIVTVGALPPEITMQPASGTITSGSTATLNVGATGAAPLSLQWYQGPSGETSAPVTGATTHDFTTPALTQTTAYWVRVSNSAGTADSNTATLTVQPAVESFSHWQTSKFTSAQLADSSVSGPSADSDGDGLTNEQEYIFGTQPLIADASVTPAINSIGSQLSFSARAATGAGYAGRTRHYAIQMTGNPETNSWTSPQSYEDVTGEDQTVSYNIPAGERLFLRLKVWLTP